MESSCLSLHHHPPLHLSTTRYRTPITPNHLKLNHSFPATTPLRLEHSHCSPLLPMSAHAESSDLAPVPPSLRTFTAFDMASLWVGLVVGVPTYYLAGSLVGLGMAWWQGIATVVAANLVVLVTLVLSGIPGTKYGISFPVLARSAFGVRGAHVPTLLRALVGCGWYCKILVILVFS